MAVTPNTTFSSGAILTAAQMNRFARGIMVAPATSTTTDSTITAEEVMLTTTFTAVNGRIYRFTYVEPVVTGSVAAVLSARFRETNIGGTILQNFRTVIGTSAATSTAILSYTATASASLTIVATLSASAGTATATRSATQIAQFIVEDIGAS